MVIMTDIIQTWL